MDQNHTEEQQQLMEQQQQQPVNNNSAPPVAYNELFPALPDSVTSSGGVSMVQQSSSWASKMRVGSSNVTQVFRVPAEERKAVGARFGEDTSSTCVDIMNRTGATIECSTGRDQSLTFIVTGKQEAVLKAKRQVLENFQTLASQTVSISKEHHRFVLGRGGQRLREMEEATGTKIQVPGQGDSSDIITVSGARDDIDRAVHQLCCISDEQSKQHRAVLPVPKKFHPFICGAHNETVQRLMSEHAGVRINVPPPSVQADDISVAGEKEGVLIVEQIITKMWRDLERRCSSVSVEVNKSQHKYVIGARGSGLAEVLQKVGVVVEMPPLDSPSGTITLRGPQDKLGQALTMVYDRASSATCVQLDCPAWCHRHIIGKKGQDIRQLTADITKVHVEFNSEANKITIEGASDEAATARERLEAVVQRLLDEMSFEELDVPVKYHKHIIGKAGANINRIKSEYGVNVSVPENESSTLVRVDGPREGVVGACLEMRQIADKLQNERERELVIDSRLHKMIIGARGEAINSIRAQFDQVIIAMPKQDEKSDIVKIRGPKDMVDQCYKHMQKLVKELQVSNYMERVSIYKQHHKYIIGRGGSNIRRIHEETGARVELPDEASDSCHVIITGRQEDVIAARRMVEKLQDELESVVQQDIIIPARFHNSIIGAGGRHIHSIMNECGGVQIKFPDAGSKSDKVSLRGPIDDVQKAKHILIDLSNEKTLQGHTVTVYAKQEHHRYLIGKRGAKIDALRTDTGTRIVFPGEGDDDADTITVIGKKENVEKARKQLELWVKDLDLTVTEEVRVAPQHHRHFVARRADVLRQLKSQFGGVDVSFPRAGADSEVVTLKGAKECVEATKQRILEIVESLESQVTIEVVIGQRYHGSVMGARGSNVQRITREHDVQIKFPERRAPEEFTSSSSSATGEADGDVPSLTNGNSSPTPSTVLPGDVIRVTGLRENCESAQAAMLALVPHTVEVLVPLDYHRFIIGQRGKGVRDLMTRYDVNITFPAPDQQSDVIRVVGTIQNTESAKEGLMERVRELDSERADRELRAYSEQMSVPAQYHPKIIGRAGAVIQKLRNKHDVNVQFPSRDQPDQETITIQGYEKNVAAARTAIQLLVDELENMVRHSLQLDSRVHARIIGGRGKNIRQIMKDFQVEVRFPRAEEAEPDTVMVSGSSLEMVEACIDHLRCLEEEYLQDVNEREEMDALVRPARDGYSNGDASQHKSCDGFVVSGAPWQQQVHAPNVASSEEFPSFGATAESKQQVVWGPRR